MGLLYQYQEDSALIYMRFYVFHKARELLEENYLRIIFYQSALIYVMIPMANIFCKSAGPVSAVGSISCNAFGSAQVRFQGQAYSYTGCHLPVTKALSIGKTFSLRVFVKFS